MKRVALVELSIWERITPLVSGYMQAFALADSTVKATYQFEKYITSTKTPVDQVTRDLMELSADVYAFSCYIWNIGMIRMLIRALKQAKPFAQIMLGGPQIMHQAQRYLDPSEENLTVCNGEGEVTFTEYLCELTEPTPDLTRVRGLSFFRDGELITTEARPRISDLESVPSPFLSGLFEPKYNMTILETNRGCPFHCGFCYWGAATNDRVYRFDEQRIRDEITWMARNEFMCIYIADANWGMLGRDVELTQHIADCAREYRLPTTILFSAAKNKPHAVTKITGILQDAGVITSQPVSMQSIDPGALQIIGRSNIKLNSFGAVQEDLRERGLSSYIELIWPLPGETLDSFKSGINTLCENNAQAIICYSHLLLNNTPIFHDRETLGLRTRPAGEPIAEGRIVIATQQVSEPEFMSGMRYFYALHGMHNTRSMHATIRYLTRQGITTFRDLFTGLAEFWAREPADDPIAQYVDRSISDADYYDLNNYGMFIHTVLHAERSRFADHLRQFMASQPWWDDPNVRLLFEVDLVNRPYVYSNTPLDVPENSLKELHLREASGRHYTIEIAAERLPVLADAVRINAPPEELARTISGRIALRIDHKRKQYPFMTSQTLDHNASYCLGMIERIENITPEWRMLPSGSWQNPD